jgi:hypothetical protein
MRLTRHAKNRLRWIRRNVSAVTETDVVAAIDSGETIGRDVKGNRHIAAVMNGVRLVLVVDEERQLVITMWREE